MKVPFINAVSISVGRSALCIAAVSAFRASLAAPAIAAAQQPTGHVLIQNVRVFDGERVVPRTSVLVSDGRIARIAPSITAPAGAQVIDGAGKTLLPGFIDSHTHSWGTALRDAAA